jgi:hypothetical protein
MTTGLRPAVMRLYDKEAAMHSLEKAVRRNSTVRPW